MLQALHEWAAVRQHLHQRQSQVREATGVQRGSNENTNDRLSRQVIPDIGAPLVDVCFALESGHRSIAKRCRLCANNGPSKLAFGANDVGVIARCR